MLLPAGGAKGFGLALLVDLMAGGLSSGAIGDAVQPLYGDPAAPYGCSNLFIAIDVAGFRPLDEFEDAASAFAGKVRASRRAPGVDAICAPGDRAASAHASFNGEVSLSAGAASALRDAALKLGVSPPDGLTART